MIYLLRSLFSFYMRNGICATKCVFLVSKRINLVQSAVAMVTEAPPWKNLFECAKIKVCQQIFPDIMEKFDLASNSNTIQSIAMKVTDDQMKQLNLENGPKESTVFMLGSKGVGKSGIINTFFDRQETPSPTLALDYSFGGRTSLSYMYKQILNVWELGNLDNSSELIEVPFRSHSLKNFAVFLVVDLSRPNNIWADIESAVRNLQLSVRKLQSEDEEVILTEKTRARISADHPDKSRIDPFPLPVIVVGGKYDLFQNFDPEIKKHVCRGLRSVVHHIGAALVFYSHKHSNLSKTVRDTLSHFGFGSPSHPFRKTVVDYHEPLMIWFGQDSWQEIGDSPENLESIGLILNLKISQLKTCFGKVPDDPAKDPGFRESLIDEIRAQKDEELLTLLRDTEVRNKFELTRC